MHLCGGSYNSQSAKAFILSGCHIPFRAIKNRVIGNDDLLLTHGAIEVRLAHD